VIKWIEYITYWKECNVSRVVEILKEKTLGRPRYGWKDISKCILKKDRSGGT
jgi:hypothetical protein